MQDLNKHGISPSQARQLHLLNRSQSLVSNKRNSRLSTEESNIYYDARHNRLHQWALRYTLGAKQADDNIQVKTRKDTVQLKRSRSVLKRATEEKQPNLPSLSYPTTSIDLLQNGDTIDDYKILKCIGRGNFGNVYHAKMNKQLAGLEHQEVAIKVVLNHAYILDNSDSDTESMDPHIRHELLLWRQLVHPHILPLIEVMHTKEAVFLVMELMHGSLLHFIHDIERHKNNPTTLERRSSISGYDRPKTSWQVGSHTNSIISEVLKNYSPLAPIDRPASSMSSNNPNDWFSASPSLEHPKFHLGDLTRQEVLKGMNEAYCRIMFCQLLSAIVYLHEDQGIIHKDLKLDNILVTKYHIKDDEFRVVCKICDFGLSCILDAEVDRIMGIIEQVEILMTDPGTGRPYPVSEEAPIKSYGSFSSMSSIASPTSTAKQFKRKLPPKVENELQVLLSASPVYTESRATGSLEYCAPEEVQSKLALVDDLVLGKVVSTPQEPRKEGNRNLWQLYDKRVNSTPHLVERPSQTDFHTPSEPFMSDKKSLVRKFLTGADIWSLGVILYAMLTGKMPFVDEFQPRLIRKILSGDYKSIPVDEESMVDYELHLIKQPQIRQPTTFDLDLDEISTINGGNMDIQQKISDKSNENCITVWGDQVLSSLMTVAWFDRPTAVELMELPWCDVSHLDATINNQSWGSLDHLLAPSRSRAASLINLSTHVQPVEAKSELWKDFPNSKSTSEKGIFEMSSYPN